MFFLTDKKIDRSVLEEMISNDAAGAIVVFEGRVRNRNDGRQVTQLEYEAYATLVEKEAEKIVLETRDKFDIVSVACAHRIGALSIGETAVWIGVCSEHRDEAYQASRYLIEQIKHRLPIWKKETYIDGTSGWVNCQSCSQGAHEAETSSTHIHHPSLDREERSTREQTPSEVGKSGDSRY